MLKSLCFISVSASATNPKGGVSRIMMSYLFLRSLNKSLNFLLSKASDGFFGSGPETKTSKFSIWDLLIT